MRFLWYKDAFAESPENVKLRCCRVMFGLTPSQYLLNVVIRKHGEKYEKIDPEFARKVKNHFYIDDLNTGVKTTDEGQELYKKFKIRFMEAGFNIRKWHTHDGELKKLMEEEDLAKGEVKVLGIRWNEEEDTLQLGIKEIFEKAESLVPTKRNVLKTIASIFDPAGFLQSVVVMLKLLFQEICITKVDWDIRLEDELAEKWGRAVKNLKNYADLIITRCYYT